MSDKFYSNSYNTMFNNSCCSKLNQMNEQQAYYQYSNMQTNNSFPYLNNIEMYNNTTQGNYQQKPPNNCLQQGGFTDSMEYVSWENQNRVLPDVEKIKQPEKVDLIELSSKDLSPASYCSNIDMLLPDCYKSCNKDVNYFNNQWYYNGNYNQKNYDLPSCAQVANKSTNEVDLNVNKYCSIQKTQDLDSIMRSCSFANEYILDNNDPMKTGNKLPDNSSMSGYFDVKFPPVETPYFTSENLGNSLTFEPLGTIDQQTEGSNDESDIIVEESDEEVTDYSDKPDKKMDYNTNKCFICNMVYTPVGRQFYFLTEESPLSMSSQKPVFHKIVELVGNIGNHQNYLCNECLGLINTIDHLQFKLQNFKSELMTKFKKTCLENGIVCDVMNPNYNKDKTKYKCKNKLTRYKCKKCKKILSFKKYCEYHLKRHKVTGCLCELCGKIYPTRGKFKHHFRKTHCKKKQIKINAFQCKNCNKHFRTKSNLTEHENFCLGILPFKCKHQHCDKKFVSATKLKNHIKLKHDKKFIAICSICNIGFVKASDYKSHMISHSTDKKFSCTKCDKSYKTLSNLNFHMKSHNDKLPFICTICDKGFMRKEYLEAHVNNHKGTKNYACTLCDKKCVSQKNLDSHMKFHDGSVKKHTCNVCGKTMTTGFNGHLRMHNNLREFECSQCNLKFNIKETLSKHIKKKHPVKTVETE